MEIFLGWSNFFFLIGELEASLCLEQQTLEVATAARSFGRQSRRLLVSRWSPGGYSYQSVGRLGPRLLLSWCWCSLRERIVCEFWLLLCSWRPKRPGGWGGGKGMIVEVVALWRGSGKVVLVFWRSWFCVVDGSLIRISSPAFCLCFGSALLGFRTGLSGVQPSFSSS